MRTRRRILSSPRVLALTAVFAVLAVACGGANPEDEAATQPEPQETSEPDSAEGDAEAYFAGKTLTFVINHDPGGNGDLFGRYVASHFGDYVPGNPRVRATNQSRVAGLNFIYEAEPDSMIIGVQARASRIITEQLEGEATIDPAEIRLIGARVPDPRVVIGPAEYSSVADAIGAEEPVIKVPGSVAGPEGLNDGYLLITWLCDRLDMPCEVFQVADDGTSAGALMIERGESNTLAGNALNSFNAVQQHIEAGTLDCFVVFETEEGLPEGLNCPELLPAGIPEELHEEFAFIAPSEGSGGWANGLFAGPETFPDYALEALREAWDAMMANEEVVEGLGNALGAEAPLSPISGAEAEEIIRENNSQYIENLERIQEIQQEFWDKYWS